MGIRIHKALGYGLTDVKVEKYRIKDDRFNDFGILGKEVEEKVYEIFTPEGYEDFCKQHHSYEKNNFFDLVMDLMVLKERREKKDNFKRKWGVEDSFIHHGEFGLPNVMLVIPCAEHESWYRFDDMIDYYIENIDSRKTRKYTVDKVDVLEDGGIYPWIGNYFNYKTKEPIKNGGMCCAFWCAINTKRDAEKSKKKNKVVPPNPDDLARLIGFNDTNDALQNLRPMIPDCVKAICKYAKVFVDDNTIFDLRPMLYTYWC